MDAGRADAAISFVPHRPRLTRVAYRMLGSVADAEDVVQDAFLRWHTTDRSEIENAEAFLVRVVTRLCLDVLKSSRRQRETYIGPWLPEPVVESEADLAEDVTLPLLLALERLSPLERAAFLLHDVFGMEFDEVAGAIGRDPAATRQLASRARQHVHEARPRFAVDQRRGMELAEAFFTASQTGDIALLKTMLAADITVTADGGGKRPAGPVPIVGFDAVVALMERMARFFANAPSQLVRIAMINGLPGYITREADGVLQTTALEIVDGKVVGLYIVRNPDKLGHLDGAALN
ncbi:MAG TPA: sigma-70 family RNA polymerase sigma factor [Devosia sp.]|jgi:RNA polymerase sigma-70 factor (ECF subfamily)|uniref:sigma-70 family RNA polymerase sigma factor n=1 Tax=Devosia sp. TaxID=1871048 RepID=UPI002DDDBA36|nr:sigma-70 family RNA polymerase sigma factor [Devosia sp.]HEV2516917.1 sigma-70 family RNA polymerase sigma factor [Devosia sp.]